MTSQYAIHGYQVTVSMTMTLSACDRPSDAEAIATIMTKSCSAGSRRRSRSSESEATSSRSTVPARSSRRAPTKGGHDLDKKSTVYWLVHRVPGLQPICMACIQTYANVGRRRTRLGLAVDVTADESISSDIDTKFVAVDQCRHHAHQLSEGL